MVLDAKDHLARRGVGPRPMGMDSTHDSPLTPPTASPHVSVTPLALTVWQSNLTDNACRMLVWLYVGDFAVRMGQSPDAYRALVGVVFTLPWVALSLLAGQVADRFPKRRLIRAAKVCELIILVGAAAAMALSPQPATAYGLLFLLATRSALFGPATFGLVGELVPAHGLARATGVVEGMTFLGAVLGTSVGGMFIDAFGDRLAIPLAILALTAVGGLALTRRIGRAPAAAPHNRLSHRSLMPLRTTWRHLHHIWHTPGMAFAVGGIVLWWAMAGLTLQTAMKLAEDTLGLSGFGTSRFFIYVGLGVALGGLSAAWLSKERIELGLVPLGGLGMAVAAMATGFAPPVEWAAALGVSMVGFFSGWFQIPLRAFVNATARHDTRGGLLGTLNLLQYTAIIASVGGVYFLLAEVLHFEAPAMFRAIGVGALIVTVGAWAVVGADVPTLFEGVKKRARRRRRDG